MRYVRLFFLVTACATAFSQAPSSSVHWRETPDETVWIGRYSNCEYGYYVSLPAGVVGHGAKSPALNRGFTINLASLQSTEAFNSTESNRFIDVYNFYDVEDHEESTAATLDYYLMIGDITNEEGVQRLSSHAESLAGLSAKRVEDRWVANSVPIRSVKILAYRRSGGILYQLTLQSPVKTFASDELLFTRIVEGFHTGKLPTGECSNN